MFEYFPGNYVWNLSVVGVMNSGGLIDEVDRACRDLREAAAKGEDVGTVEFLAVWTDLVDALVARAESEEAAGHAQRCEALHACDELPRSRRADAECALGGAPCDLPPLHRPTRARSGSAIHR